MFHQGFENDATFFELIAQTAGPEDRKHLRQVAATYRSLAKNGETRFRSRREHWSNRAATCRTLSEQFENPTCRTQLQRLAETYDLLAGTCDDVSQGPLSRRSEPAEKR
jgi:hypothetical protein